MAKRMDIKKHKHDWRANVYGQCKSWLDNGLQPRAVTRDLNWGVKVPLKDAQGKVLYVWFDAPLGYISASKEWAEKTIKIGKYIGKIKKQNSFILLVKIILCFTVLFSLLC